MDAQMTSSMSQDSKNTTLLMWIGTIFFGFIPGLIFFLIKKDDLYIQAQSKEALNWSITAMIGYMVSFILSFILIGVFGFLIIGMAHLIFCIIGAVAASKGNNFRVPLTIRLIK